MPDTENNKNENGSKLSLELIPCSRCGNPFFRDPKSESDDVCENCIKLEQRKRQLQLGVFDKVIEVENAMEESINEMKNQLTVSRGKFNKDFFLKKIKNRSQALNKSIELIEKIEETNDEKYIEEYKALFEEMKKKYS
ncbi:MAG: hypothetical protein GF311_06640 [Candidatus Lokiarchaeota archaeon]|jgi:uncharacterized Zn finger protein (UPF0148 family)|nr:hypothetical protein [Candidatus Lokiarchaeota archaeon]